MGTAASSRSYLELPPLAERDVRTLLSYNLDEKHIRQLWKLFCKVDRNNNTVWTIQELYNVIDEPRSSMRAPIIERLFFLSDSKGQGVMEFEDWIISMTSFCALLKEEVLHLLFIIIDKNRNGLIEKQELMDFFSYVPPGTGSDTPVFPVNNKSALDEFKRGKWTGLEFEGLAQLCQHFPYIPYPAYHVQELYRKAFLGKAFWDRLDTQRSRPGGTAGRVRRTTMPGTTQRVEVKMPGSCSMQELLEYSQRKTRVQGDKVVAKDADSDEDDDTLLTAALARERDDEISRCPLLAIIRNPRSMYYIPYKAPSDKPKQPKANDTKDARLLELQAALDLGAAGNAAMAEDYKDSDSSGSDESSYASEGFPALGVANMEQTQKPAALPPVPHAALPASTMSPVSS